MFKSRMNWKISDIFREDYDSQTTVLNPAIEQLVLARQLATAESLDTFAKEETIHHDPFLFSEMSKIITRINEAIDQGEPILIYGDYDADGVTGTSILVRCLRELGALVDYYIPNRFYEGYGPNEDAFMQAIADGYQLVITVDNGIAGVDEAEILLEHGVDLIITDHHQVKETLPRAYAILHPELDENYPFHHLSGAGVALKVAEALLQEVIPEDFYAIAMLGTIGDVVPLIDENRSIVKRGLAALRETEIEGLNAMMDLAGTEKSEVTEVNVGFELCPRLNAPGRMDEAALSVECLIAESEEEAKLIADQIESFNSERQKVTQKVLEEATKLVDAKTLAKKKVVILYSPNWHEGILGIVAGRLAKQWQKAVFVVTDDHEGFLKGSARAVEGYHLFELLNKCQDLIERFGGHALAAGITFAPENLQALEDKMNELLQEVEVTPSLQVDLSLPLADLNISFVEQLSILAPFGEGNRPPVIELKNVYVKNVKPIGNKLQHLKFTLYQEKHSVDVIAFNQAPLAMYLTPDTLFSFVGEAKINEWNGNRSVQFHFIDVLCNEFQLIDLRNRQAYEQRKDQLQLATTYTNAAEIDDIETLVINQLPSSKEELMTLITRKKPGNIVIAPLESNVTFAPREKFVSVYKVVKQHGPITLNHQMINYFMRLGISKNELLFILQVFFEVELVIIKNGSVFPTDSVTKRDLAEAPTYQSQKAKLEMLEFFELTTWSELKTTFKTAREEMTHES
ncbi:MULTISPECIES: single-stranded-DNA-specific exonuclease RecJ [unclassified Turicibacter]|uniref:single-stranded-DNA-specific exonuclease RecJ n=1 Tax=unclassified Turicibacter TaxID=2638206 RepID=UPI0006BF70D3|nr:MULTISPECIES: single-stranded-DNA-specific exonuclease RecJ [unclassified Turicibacter]MCU7194254.1 single-stranded-DNA-specific exonuclease RecJ [Turicibacter sp. T129]MCU7207232.1 single-stranded-DNA-specific exonuclease RecJ [Turicibacter sp. GALT-G1]MEE0427354.1 single-stranded-DNA-specific exonuclease RecJ [Turicibacter sp.]CUN82616.1 Single-stranded-DNA-specific exonuclease recJ [Turicibacter sanguinis]